MVIERFIKQIPKQPDSPHGQDFMLMQDKLERTLSGLTDDCPFLDGVLLEDIALTTSTTLVQHKLDKAYRGYIVVLQDADASIYVDTTSTADNKLYLPLKAGSAVNVSLWVF